MSFFLGKIGIYFYRVDYAVIVLISGTAEFFCEQMKLHLQISKHDKLSMQVFDKYFFTSLQQSTKLGLFVSHKHLPILNGNNTVQSRHRDVSQYYIVVVSSTYSAFSALKPVHIDSQQALLLRRIYVVYLKDQKIGHVFQMILKSEQRYFLTFVLYFGWEFSLTNITLQFFIIVNVNVFPPGCVGLIFDPHD